MNYFVVEPQYAAEHAYISAEPRGLERRFELLKGISRVASWPDDLTLSFSDRHPEGLQLLDAVPNTFSWLIASPALQELLRRYEVAPVEYLPIRIVDHKGRLASDAYCVVNFIELVEAVDRERSVYEPDAFYEDRIGEIDRLILLDTIQTEGPAAFRLRERPRMLLFREDLMRAVEDEGLTGLAPVPTDTFTL